MTAYDFSPLFRSTVGFDRMQRLMESTLSADDASTYPPYNIAKTGDDAYEISMAVAGFSSDDIEIEQHETTLTVSGRARDAGEGKTYLHRGIAARAFKRAFHLAEYVRVANARLENGLLHVDLVREVPEARKPRRIDIATGSRPDNKQIEQSAA